MKGHENVLSELNAVLTEVLTAINQTFLHARIFQNWGLEELNERIYKHSIHEMKAADQLIHRILFLEGLPNLQRLKRLSIGEKAEEMIQADLNRASENAKAMRSTIVTCEQSKDFQSRELLEELLGEEEEIIDWLEMQQELIRQTGLKNYLTQQTHS